MSCMRILANKFAKQRDDAQPRNLASAVNIGAFNLGNAIGAALGGGVIATGLGYPAVALAGAATAMIGLATVLSAARSSHKTENRRLCGA